jgi:hypothetical protein
MPRKISRDVKIAAIKLYERHLLDVDDILDCCNFSRRTWFRILKLWHETGDVVSETQSLSGRLRILEYGDIHYLQYLIEDNPDYFLDELLHLLKTNRFISLHFTTVFRELQRARVNHKKLQRIARERDEAQRIDFIRRMAQYDPEELGFIDEVSRDERSIGRHYGWSKRSRRAKKRQPFVRGRRTSTVGVLTLDGFVAGTAVEGSLTKDVMLEWLEFNVVGSCLASYNNSTDKLPSYQNVVPTLDHLVSSSSTTRRFTMESKFLNLPIASVSVLNTCRHIPPISTLSRKHSARSNISCGVTKITTTLLFRMLQVLVRERVVMLVMEFCLICTRS